MFSEKNRLKSFSKGWKTLSGFKHCTPENFAKAGFYNASSKENPDNVKCFACMKQLDGWEKDDDPWEEHKKRGQTCMFVQLRAKTNGDFKLADVISLHLELRKNILKEIEQKKLAPVQECFDLITGIRNGDLSILDNI